MFCRQVMKEWSNKGEKIFTVEELRLLLGVDNDEYPKYANFKQKVILAAQREINELSDVYFDFEEEKESRKVVRIRLLIRSNPKNKENIDIDKLQKEAQQKKFISREDLAHDLVVLALKKYGTILDTKKILINNDDEICHFAIMQTLQEIQENGFDSEKMKKPSYIYGILKNKNSQHTPMKGQLTML